MLFTGGVEVIGESKICRSMGLWYTLIIKLLITKIQLFRNSVEYKTARVHKGGLVSNLWTFVREIFIH